MELVSLVSQYRVISVVGADAREFLQAQLTCDLASLPADTGCAGALLTPKGKVLAAGYLLPQDSHWLMLVNPQVAEQTLTHLSRYILRAKVEIGGSELSAVGVINGSETNDRSEGPDFSQLPGLSANLFALPDGRQIGVSSSAGEATDIALWRQRDLRSGVVTVNADIHDRFIPQMLGLDALGAVSFSKGCYPGQEIVARARHLGRVKRGLALLSSTSALLSGEALHDVSGKRVGEVIDSLETGAGWIAHGVVSRDADQIDGVSDCLFF